MHTAFETIRALPCALLFVIACGSEDSPATAARGGSAGDGSANTGGSSSTDGQARLRFLYRADWKEHLGACAAISDYRIKFGAIPVPVTAPVEVTPDSLGEYVTVDGRTYEDEDVLHVFTCSKSQTSKQTVQVYGKFGTDLPLEPAKRYTVTLAGDAATIAEDP